MELADKGVDRGYVDRAFAKDEGKLNDAETPRLKRRKWEGVVGERKVDLAAFAMVQASRRFKPGQASLAPWLLLYGRQDGGGR